MLLASGPIRKAGTKSEGGGGGGVGGGVLSASGPIQKAGKGWGGGGCLAEEGKVPYMKGGVATPHPPLPGQRYTRQEYFASNTSAQSERVKKINSQLCRLRITRMFNAAGRPSDSTRPFPCTCGCIVWITSLVPRPSIKG